MEPSSNKLLDAFKDYFDPHIRGESNRKGEISGIKVASYFTLVIPVIIAAVGLIGFIGSKLPGRVKDSANIKHGTPAHQTLETTKAAAAKIFPEGSPNIDELAPEKANIRKVIYLWKEGKKEMPGVSYNEVLHRANNFVEDISVHFIEINFAPSILPDIFNHSIFIERLEKLNLSGEFTQLPPSIICLSALKELDLSSNKLTELPDEIGRLSSLQMLNARMCSLSALPASIGDLAALKDLDLTGNNLTTLPSEIGQLSSLRKLDLSNNKFLTELPLEILNLHHDCQINLHSCPLSQTTLDNIHKAIETPGYSGPQISF